MPYETHRYEPALQDGQWPRRSAGIYGIKDQGQYGKVPDLSLRSPQGWCVVMVILLHSGLYYVHPRS